ncbi:hypothetical protein TNCV_2763491 [Trichonephila clavipes]|nr:hypothetical protein TNCV_2763491 [Trichonephila clavipes]
MNTQFSGKTMLGGGVAGSVVATRLSEKECVSVLLLEAGKSPPKSTDIPAAARSFINTDIDWQYLTAPQKHTGRGLINNEMGVSPFPLRKLVTSQWSSSFAWVSQAGHSETYIIRQVNL